MTGILKIDLPDDFKIGDCLKCKYADNFFGGCKVKSLIKDLGSLDCPLEIQENNQFENNGDCETCKHYYRQGELTYGFCADCILRKNYLKTMNEC